MKTTIGIFITIAIISLFACNSRGADRDYIAPPRPELAGFCVGTPPSERFTKFTANLVKEYQRDTKQSVTIMTAPVHDLLGSVVSNRLEAIISYRAANWKEDWSFVKARIGVGPTETVIGYDLEQPIYLVLDPTKAKKWDGFQKWLLSDRGQDVIRQQGLKPLPYSERR